MSSRTSGVAVAVKARIGRPAGDSVGAPAAPGRVGERAVVGPEVVAPLRDAVGLVHGEAREGRLASRSRRKASDANRSGAT